MRYKSDPKLDSYIGSWKSGKRNGYGTLILKDSARFVGDWKNDNLRFGEFQGSDGIIMSGNWSNEYLNEGTMRMVGWFRIFRQIS